MGFFSRLSKFFPSLFRVLYGGRILPYLVLRNGMRKVSIINMKTFKGSLFKQQNWKETDDYAISDWKKNEKTTGISSSAKILSLTLGVSINENEFSLF